jgi:hypothetical protein
MMQSLLTLIVRESLGFSTSGTVWEERQLPPWRIPRALPGPRRSRWTLTGGSRQGRRGAGHRCAASHQWRGVAGTGLAG